jgi:hypothetical protein
MSSQQLQGQLHTQQSVDAIIMGKVKTPFNYNVLTIMMMMMMMMMIIIIIIIIISQVKLLRIEYLLLIKYKLLH